MNQKMNQNRKKQSDEKDDAVIKNDQAKAGRPDWGPAPGVPRRKIALWISAVCLALWIGYLAYVALIVKFVG